MKRSMAVAMLAMVTMSLVMVHQTEAINCNQLANMLAPCLNYLKNGGTPTSSCCNGARQVQGATRSQADRRAACKCAKSAAGKYQVRGDAVSSLPGKCGISTTIPINPSVNCNSIP
uniref:non-specific lipid-transfer protein AP10-like n=1 Tax=Erigeron canadensis TaxID=72917 RepID=UPI001CB9A0B0|nr:non-specific lipid-transfer protein AP10-like [Erigeron canadensis]